MYVCFRDNSSLLSAWCALWLLLLLPQGALKAEALHDDVPSSSLTPHHRLFPHPLSSGPGKIYQHPGSSRFESYSSQSSSSNIMFHARMSARASGSVATLRGQSLQARPLVARRPLQQRGSLQVVNLTSNDIKNGMTILIDNAPWKVVEFLHVKPGKGSAFVRSKIKSYINGNTVDKTFRAGEPLEGAVVEKRESQYTYAEGDNFVFMDMETYEESRIPEDPAWSKYLKEGTVVNIVSWEGRTISVDLPNTLNLEVTETDPGVKGNTQGGGSKPATLETGATINVPLFIAQGEIVQVDTRTDEYLGRASK